jgi:hypothetical protein
MLQQKPTVLHQEAPAVWLQMIGYQGAVTKATTHLLRGGFPGYFFSQLIEGCATGANASVDALEDLGAGSGRECLGFGRACLGFGRGCPGGAAVGSATEAE